MTACTRRTVLARAASLAAIGCFPAVELACAAPAPAELWVSLEAPPSIDEVNAALARGIRIFDFDLEKPGAEAAVRAVKAGRGRVTAYHIGGGGGRAWGSVKADEWVRRYDSPRDFLALTQDVKGLVSKGADAVHFDNTHRFSGRRLESIADAIRAGGAGFIAKNNADKWRLVMERRADLVPDYAMIEDAMFDADETQAAYALHARGVTVFIVGFRTPLEAGANGVTDAYAREYAANNPWANVLIIEDERAFDSRTGTFVR